MKNIAIIPARGGSKSIPDKNIKYLGGKPLIAYPIELAKSISKINRVIVSTDSDKIAKVAKDFGAEVPFKRPKRLAKDETPTLPVLRHTISWLEENENFRPDNILLLYPTCPFIERKDIEKGIKLLKTNNSVVSVKKDYGRYWKYDSSEKKYKTLYPEKRINRQYYKPLYRENGAIYFSKYEVIMDKNKVVDEENVGFLVMEKELVDIDNKEDWKKAEDLIKNERN